MKKNHNELIQYPLGSISRDTITTGSAVFFVSSEEKEYSGVIQSINFNDNSFTIKTDETKEPITIKGKDIKEIKKIEKT